MVKLLINKDTVSGVDVDAGLCALSNNAEERAAFIRELVRNRRLQQTATRLFVDFLRELSDVDGQAAEAAKAVVEAFDGVER